MNVTPMEAIQKLAIPMSCSWLQDPWQTLNLLARLPKEFWKSTHNVVAAQRVPTS
jgi:hypothetical protein